MTYYGVNATGWVNLTDGHMVLAVLSMYNTAFLNWTVAILFLVYQIMLYLKTQNSLLCWITGIFFTGLYAASRFVNTMSVQIMFIIMVFELAIIQYIIFGK